MPTVGFSLRREAVRAACLGISRYDCFVLSSAEFTSQNRRSHLAGRDAYGGPLIAALRPNSIGSMKITEVVCQILRIPSIQAKTASSQDSVLVRVRTDSGLEGIGEADSSPEVVKAIIDAPFSHNIACGLRQILVGENPLEHERLWQTMYRRTMYFGRTAVGITAMAAVDMALWDLKGKAFGQPVHRLLGGARHSRIRGYASILFGHDGKETRDIARRRVEAGYTAGQYR